MAGYYRRVWITVVAVQIFNQSEIQDLLNQQEKQILCKNPNSSNIAPSTILSAILIAAAGKKFLNIL